MQPRRVTAWSNFALSSRSCRWKCALEDVKKSLRDISFDVGGCKLASGQTDKFWKRSKGQFPGKSGCSLLHFDRRADSDQNWGSELHKSRYRKSIKWVKFKLPLYSENHSKIASMIVWNTEKIQLGDYRKLYDLSSERKVYYWTIYWLCSRKGWNIANLIL
jgi:hypothetical protein